MRTFFSCLFGVFALFSFSNCANGKRLQEEAPVAINQVYYTTNASADESTATDLNLFIPVQANSLTGARLDSVYFRGKKSGLRRDSGNPNIYIANFQIGEDRDLVMSSDPREEYGNQVPMIKEKTPFDLEQDEAMLVFTKNDKKGYYKISGIKKKDSVDVKIKNPENIRH